MPEFAAFTPDAFLEACLPGSTKELLDLKECITRLNAQDDEVHAVLILGESGVGKTYLAKAIAMHRCWLKELFLKTEGERPSAEKVADQKQWYARARGAGILKASGEPYQEVPLPLLEGNIARSWLFGHKKGAFTGADKDQKGFLGEEDITDVLLDEIGYASLDMQRSLLQVIQSGEFYRVGSTKKEITGARLIFATNQNLEELVRRREFQEDLWWRLTDHVLYLPPLRERRNEIKTIAKGIVASLNQEHIRGDGSGYLHLTPKDIDWADSHDWQGNIRELEKTIHRWFFYRGARPLKEVWLQIKPFIPRRNVSKGQTFALDESHLRGLLKEQLQAAVVAGAQLPSPEKLLDELAAPARNRASNIFAACIDELKLPSGDLERLFKDYKLSSLRSWLARNRA